MTNSRSTVFLVALAFLLTGGNADAQKVDMSSTSARQRVLFLNFTNNRQQLPATVGQQIEITLGTVGPQQYGEPQVSSPAVRHEGTALKYPVIPGGPTFIYIFDAAAEGEADIKVPIVHPSNPDLANRLSFAIKIRVGPAPDNLRQRGASRSLDQENSKPWSNAWMNLDYPVNQTFVPLLPRLTGVEVDLVAAKPEQTNGELTMLISTEERALASVWKTVAVADCGHVLFLLPGGGLPMSPGQVYSISLSGNGGVFGWKYVVGGYANGAASLQGKPLLKNSRSTFLFRTFGAR